MEDAASKAKTGVLRSRGLGDGEGEGRSVVLLLEGRGPSGPVTSAAALTWDRSWQEESRGLRWWSLSGDRREDEGLRWWW